MENLPGNFKLIHFTYICCISCVESLRSTPSTLQNGLFHHEKAVLSPIVNKFELFLKKKAILEKTECEILYPAFVRVDNIVYNNG